eukprot:341683-Amphidinium_carterae.1
MVGTLMVDVAVDLDVGGDDGQGAKAITCKNINEELQDATQEVDLTELEEIVEDNRDKLHTAED